MTDEKKPSNIVAIKTFFGLSAQEAMKEARTLTEQDKQQLGDGIRDGSLTY